jgi:hypothetical protein
VLAGERLILTSSNDEIITLSPYTGEPMNSVKLPGPAAVTPVVADGVVYVLTADAELLAFR